MIELPSTIERETSNIILQIMVFYRYPDSKFLQRFIPSEFGADPDKVQTLEMDHDFYKKKAEIRRCIEKEGIPHTYISCNFFQRYLLPSLIQPGLKTPPTDKVKIFGSGNVKGQLSQLRSWNVQAFCYPQFTLCIQLLTLVHFSLQLFLSKRVMLLHSQFVQQTTQGH